MELSIKELNELIYCLARTIADDCGSWNTNFRKELFNKLYTELEKRNAELTEDMRKQGFIPIEEFTFEEKEISKDQMPQEIREQFD